MFRSKSKRSRKEASTSRQQQPQQPHLIDGIFVSERAKREFTDWVCNRNFIEERGLEIDVPAAWNWENFLKQPEPGIASIVHEFYANAGDTLDQNVSIVRGIEVDYSPDAINTYYGTRTDYNGHDFYSYSLNSIRASTELIESIPRFFNPDARWNIVNGNRVHIDYDAFKKADRAIIDFVKARLKPSKHRVQIPTEIVFLAYCIRTHRTIDIGLQIKDQIKMIASCGGKKRIFLCFPSLITELCRNAGVPIPQSNQVKVMPLPMISRTYMERHYHDGDLRIQRGANTGEEEDDDTQEGSMEAAHPYSPMDFDHGYTHHRWEEFYRENREFMDEQRGYLQRQQDATWYLVQSQYGHNQAALGHTPTFPTPPPWCNDPQYMPWHVRQPPPPPH